MNRSGKDMFQGTHLIYYITLLYCSILEDLVSRRVSNVLLQGTLYLMCYLE